MQFTRLVDSSCEELSNGNGVIGQSSGDDNYMGSQGGGKTVPSLVMKHLASTAGSLVTLFLFIVPLAFFKKASTTTDIYCYEDWVIEIWQE